MKLGFIGAGNMGGAILRGVLHSGYVKSQDVWVSETNQSLLEKVVEQTGVHPATDSVSLVKACDVIVLAVKPVYLYGVIDKIKCYAADKAFVSIAAGWSFEMLKDTFGNNARILRVMPNTPALVGEGMTALCEENTLTQEQFSFVKGLFKVIGQTAVLPERLFDGVIALSGSSPAYVFMMIEAMADGGVKEGIPRALAYQMAAQAVLGAAKMVLTTGKHPGALKDDVCSPAGTTIDAVAALEEKGFRAAILGAMDVCAKKSRQMTQK